MNLLVAQTRRKLLFFISFLLLTAALWSVLRNHEVATAAWHAIRDPNPMWAIALPICMLLTALCTAAGLQLLTNRVARETRVGFSEMLALTCASTLGNFIPLQPGLVGRVAYQHQVHGIPVAISLLLALQSTLLTIGAVIWLGLALLLVHAGQLSWLAAPTSILLLTPMLLSNRNSAMMPAFAWRFVEVLLSAVRTYAAFTLIGKPIDPLSALVFGCAANAANCLPMIGNGLGIREWVIGLLAPTVAGIATPDALAAELVNRGVELLVFIPTGLASSPGIARRVSEAMKTRRITPDQPFAANISMRMLSNFIRRDAGSNNDQ